MCDFRKNDSPKKKKKSLRGGKKPQVCLGEFSICVDFVIGRAPRIGICYVYNEVARSLIRLHLWSAEVKIATGKFVDSLVDLFLGFLMASWKNHKLSPKPTNSIQIAILNTFRWQSDLAIVNLRWVSPCNIEGQGHPIALPVTSAFLHMSHPSPRTLGFSLS